MNPTLPIQNRGVGPAILQSPNATTRPSLNQASGNLLESGGLWAQQIRTSSGGPRAWADYTPTPGAAAMGSFKFHTSGNFTQSGRLVSATSPPTPLLIDDMMKKADSGQFPPTPSRVWPQTPDASSPNPFARPIAALGLPLQAPPEKPESEARGNAEMKLLAGRQLLNEAFRVKNTFIEVDSDEEEPEMGVPRGQSAPVITTRALGSISNIPNRTLVIPMGSITESDTGQLAEQRSVPAAPYVAPYSPPVVQLQFPSGPRNGLASKGSAQHGTGKCRPCAWFFKEQGCSNDYECGYCHLCPDGELKARKKSKVTAMRMGALAPAKAGQPSGPRTLKLAPMLDAA